MKFITEERLKELSKRPFYKMYPEALEKLKAEICVTCGNKVKGFKDDISITEYAISGMCQKCQDSIFDITP